MKHVIIVSGVYLVSWKAGKLKSSPHKIDAKIYNSEFMAAQEAQKLNIAFKYVFTIHPYKP